jgi:predicted Zn-dependent peptidase
VTATDPSDAGHRTTTLDSGLRVVSERVPGVRSVALGFFVPTGSAAERDSEAGISHLLEHMLFRGTARYGSQEIDEIFDALGAEVNAGTDKEATSLYTRVLDCHLERAFDVMADMVFRPRFGELEAEREVVLEEIAMYEDDPQDRVFDVLSRAVFGPHPLGRPVIGRAEVIAATTREQLAAFHRARYRPERIVLAAAGSIDHDALVQLACEAEALREAIHVAAGSAAAPSAEAAVQAEEPELRRRVSFLEKDTEQYHVCVGGPGIAHDDERRFALRVLENVLGGSSSSRLFQEVRERRGLAYAVYCFSSLYSHTGELGVYLGTRPDKLAPAMEVLAAELRRVVEDPATPEELDRARENLKGRAALALESTGARMSRDGSAIMFGLPILSLDEVVARIDAVGVEQLRELAAELLAPDSLSVAGIGPDEQVFATAIEPLGATAPQAAAELGAASAREAAP